MFENNNIIINNVIILLPKDKHKSTHKMKLKLEDNNNYDDVTMMSLRRKRLMIWVSAHLLEFQN